MSVRSRMSVQSNWSKSARSVGGSVLSERDVIGMKKMLKDKEREERRNNIVIKGLGRKVGMDEKGVEDWLKELIGVECKVMSRRVIRGVLIAKLESGDVKREVMQNKKKLGEVEGGKYFIDNDLTWEERSERWEMNEWRMSKLKQGKDVKLGKGFVMEDGRWKKWSEVREAGEEKELNGAGKKGKEDGNRERTENGEKKEEMDKPNF